MTKREQWKAAAILDRLAALVARGEVTAPSGFVGRLEGAAVTLKTIGGANPRGVTAVAGEASAARGMVRELPPR